MRLIGLFDARGCPTHAPETREHRSGPGRVLGLGIGRLLPRFTPISDWFSRSVRDQLDPGDLAYFHDGGDTTIRLRLYDDGGPNGYDTLTIALTGFTGSLSANDFDL